MSKNFESSNHQESPEEFQEKEKIAALLREANEGRMIIDLIMESFGQNVSIPDVLVLKIEGDNLTLTYIADDGDLGEEIPVNINQIK